MASPLSSDNAIRWTKLRVLLIVKQSVIRLSPEDHIICNNGRKTTWYVDCIVLLDCIVYEVKFEMEDYHEFEIEDCPVVIQFEKTRF